MQLYQQIQHLDHKLQVMFADNPEIIAHAYTRSAMLHQLETDIFQEKQRLDQAHAPVQWYHIILHPYYQEIRQVQQQPQFMWLYLADTIQHQHYLCTSYTELQQLQVIFDRLTQLRLSLLMTQMQLQQLPFAE